MQTSQQSHPFRRDLLVMASAIIGLAWILVSLFRWTLVDWLTPFLEPLLEMALGTLLLGLVLVSVIQLALALRKQTNIRKSLFALGINLLALLAIIFVPFNAISTSINFRWHYEKRMQVVNAIANGELSNTQIRKTAFGDLVHLPPQYSGLSAGGDDIVVVQSAHGTTIFFYTYRGILDNFSGFVYSSNDTPPAGDDFGGDLIEIERVRQNWYWVAST